DLCPLHGCPTNQLLPFGFGQIEQAIDFRPEQTRSRIKCCVCGMRRFVVPWTDILTDVTAEKMVADSFALRFGNFTAQFDGRVSDALSAVQNIGLDNRLRRTGIDASSARATPIRYWNIDIDLEIGKDAAEKEPGAGFLINDAGILSEPSDAGIFSVNAFQKRTCIDVCPGLLC